MKKEDKCAYCIATYNNPDRITAVICAVAANCEKYGIDIYIYDSSEGNATRLVVEHAIECGFRNIYYVPMDSSISIDNKVVSIFSGYGLQKKYKYIWLAKDRTILKEEGIREIAESMEKNYEVIFLVSKVFPEPNVNEYTEITQFYKDWGWLATSLDTTIYNYESLLCNFDEDIFRQKYFYKNENGFDQFAVLFDCLAKLKKAKIRIVYEKMWNLSEATSSWHRIVFWVWTELWIRVNNALPDCYEPYKNEVIRKAINLPWILGSVDQFIVYKKLGVLNEEALQNLQGHWQELFDISIDVVKMIINGEENTERLQLINYLFRLFAEKKYDEIGFLYSENCKLLEGGADNAVNRILENLYCCVNVYGIEKRAKVGNGIFQGISDYHNVVDKYVTMKYLLRRLEYDIAPETWNEIVVFIKDNHISKECICFLIAKTSMDKEKVLNRVRALFMMQGEKWENEYE